MLSSIFEAIFYPLDTLKTRLYCDLNGNYKGYVGYFYNLDLINKCSVKELYSGVGFKLIYNVAFLYHLRNIYENDVMS